MRVARWTLPLALATLVASAVAAVGAGGAGSSGGVQKREGNAALNASKTRGAAGGSHSGGPAPRSAGDAPPGAVGRPPSRSALLSSTQRVGEPPTLPAGTIDLGPVAPQQRIRIDVSLRPRDPAALGEFVEQVSNPSSPDYRHYLAKGQFGPRFGPSQATIGATLSALRAMGLEPGQASSDGLLVPASGSAAAVEAALATPLEEYRLADGEVGYANTEAPRLPSAIAPQVQGVIGLQDLLRPRPTAVSGGTPGAPGGSARLESSAQPSIQACSGAEGTGAYSSQQLASAYGFDGLYGSGVSGAGVTVAVYELSDIIPSDINQYQSCYGTSANVQQVELDGGGDNSLADGQLEADADTETVSSLAPGSSILVYEAPDTDSGPTDEWARIVDDDSAQVVTTSWGACESPTLLPIQQTEETFFEQAAAQGQTVLAASGDSGSRGCGGTANSVDDPASQPFVTGVGGTDLTSPSDPPAESAWSGSGGGVSGTWDMPSWQQGEQIAAAESSSAGCSLDQTGDASWSSYPTNGSYCREVPDVSADADQIPGYAVYYTGPSFGALFYGWGSVGGTSLSAPLWASLVSLSDQSCGGSGVGFANPILYGIESAGGAGLNDVTQGSNGAYSAGPGYDMVTGLGSPNGAVLAPELCPTPTVASVSPAAGPDAGGTEVTIKGTGFSVMPGATSFDFGAGSPATNVSCASTTVCTATTPSGSTGVVQVSTRVGSRSSTTDGQYLYTGPSDYNPVQPARIADTRPGSGEPDAGQKLGPGANLVVQVGGEGGVPSTGATAVVLNVTVTDATASSYLTVYPAGTSRPLASNLNFTAGSTVANLVEVALGANASVSVYNAQGDADVVVDVEGYTRPSSGATFTPLGPARIADTRPGSGEPDAGQKLGPGGNLVVQVGGEGGVPSTGATAVVLNVTVTDATALSYLTVYPAGTSRPLASNLNFTAGETLPNRVMVQLPSSGAISIYNAAGYADVVVDVGGYFSSGGTLGFNGTTPTRILDTRPGSDSPDIGSTLGPGGTLAVPVAGVGAVPANAKAIVANVTVTDTTDASFLTAFPGGGGRPLASDLNWSAGETVPNLVVTKLGAGGTIDIYNEAGYVNVIVDVVGWYSS